MRIDLPFLPVSTNAAYATNFKTGRRFKTKAYAEFIENIGIYLPREKIEGEVEIEMNFYYSLYYKNGNRRKIDPNNFEKTLTDALVKFGLFEDDCWIRRTVIESHEGEPATVIEIKKFEV